MRGQILSLFLVRWTRSTEGIFSLSSLRISSSVKDWLTAVKYMASVRGPPGVDGS